jgi:hypothetical protein
MIRVVTIASLLVLLTAAPLTWAAPSQTQMAPAGESTLTLPAGTQLSLAVTTPVWAKTAKAGDPVYTQTNFPVTVGSNIAIPPGTYVQGSLQAVTPPTRKVKQAQLQIVLTKIIFSNGYTIEVPGATAVANVTVKATTANDLLMDNGAQFEITLAAPLALDRRQILSAIPLTRTLIPGQFKTATLCRNVAATQGTPDTVIPGSAGTPSTVIPGGPGMPDTVIPGTPATPGTTIPGTPGSPGYYCPAPPLVISSTPIN